MATARGTSTLQSNIGIDELRKRRCYRRNGRRIRLVESGVRCGQARRRGDDGISNGKHDIFMGWLCLHFHAQMLHARAWT